MTWQRRSREMHPGLRYMLEHGHAADGSSGENREPTQHLSNPPAHNPTSSETVHAWVRARALGDPQMQQAGREHR